MKTRSVILTAVQCSTVTFGAIVLAACSGSATVQPTVQVSAPPPQQTIVQQQPVQQVMMVNAGWVPGGVYDDVANNMALRARQFAAGYGVASDLIRATIRQGMEGTTVPGTVQAGYCYRIIAVGGTGVRDLDLFLYNQAGQVMDQDRATDNYPVLGLARPLCIPPGLPPQSAQMRVRAYSGSGAIGVQMFAQPFNGQMPTVVQQPGMVVGVGQPGMVYR